MDCREFRKLHFAYLDDTLPGDTMTVAQRHVMACDSCAAHDTMVRRSLMLVRNMSVIEPSVAFRRKMQARLDETRAETQRERSLRLESDFKRELKRDSNSPNRISVKPPIVLSAVAASVLMMGAIVWRQSAITKQVVAETPVTSTMLRSVADTTLQPIHLTPAMVQAMSTGNPMWPAALMVDDAPAQLVNSEFTTVKSLRD